MGTLVGKGSAKVEYNTRNLIKTNIKLTSLNVQKVYKEDNQNCGRLNISDVSAVWFDTQKPCQASQLVSHYANHGHWNLVAIWWIVKVSSLQVSWYPLKSTQKYTPFRQQLLQNTQCITYFFHIGMSGTEFHLPARYCKTGIVFLPVQRALVSLFFPWCTSAYVCWSLQDLIHTWVMGVWGCSLHRP